MESALKPVYSLAVDIGGTFTDVVLRGSDGQLFVDKTLTTPRNLLEGFFAAVAGVLAKAALQPSQINGLVVHATTVVTNALIERKGETTALLTTEGFCDVLAIRNEHRYDMYDPQIEFAPPLIPRSLTFGVPERTLADGTVLQAPDLAAVDRVAESLRAAGVASVAICFLNSYANPENEQAVAARLRERLPALFISVSAEVAPQIREYPRASTTAINAYTMPVSRPYLRGLAARLREEGLGREPLIMLSSGGIIGVELAGRHPVRMIESGPAAGALAASHYAELLGLDRLMSFDMGGTTAKACLIEERRPLVAGVFEADRKYRFKEGSGMPVTIPSIDMIEIGAGGGSIARVDELGLLKVGPQSAGAEPGPASYGRGGTEPTVTDADLVLGLLDAKTFLGGEMRLDAAAAEAAVARLGERLGTGSHETARGIYRVVAEAMAAATRAHATDRGVDYRGLPLFAFGGAGPVHACEVGGLLGSTAVIFPPQASVLSAFGTLVTPVRLDLVRSALGMLDAIDWARTDALISAMAEEGVAALENAGCARAGVSIAYGADLRYFGQQNELSVTLPDDPRQQHDIAAIRTAFERAYQLQYGFTPSHVPLEIVSWRLTVCAPDVPFHAAQRLPARPGQAKGSRRVHLWQDEQVVPVYDRAVLAAGQQVEGPAIIEERETTLVLPPGWSAAVDRYGCVIATRGERA
jgi:N-methylhydantoinase A